MARVFIDDKLRIPIRYAAWDWPRRQGGKPELIEEERRLADGRRMAEVMKSDYIRTAKSFGMPPHMISRYAVKNLLVPVTTMIAMTYGYLLSGTVLVEVVFTWPGLGLYAVEAMNHSDYEPIMAVVLISAGFYLLVYVLSDILSAIIDPRIRVGR